MDFEFQSFTMVREWTVAQRTFLKDKARACVAVGGGVFEGRKV